MKLYRINNTYYGTQSDAKPAATALGIKHADIGNYETDVPTTKDGLIAYLNNMLENNSDTIVEERTGPKPLGEIAPMHEPIDTPAPLVRALQSISVEEEISKADYPNALRLAEHATHRVAEHLRDMRNGLDLL